MTAVCKVDGCDQDAVQVRGTYGHLCERHRAERKDELAQQRNGHNSVRLVAADTPDLIELATRVVKARGVLEDAIHDLEDRLHEIDQQVGRM